METSLSIHPDQFKDTEIIYKDIGNFISYTETDKRYVFECDHGWVCIQFYTKEMIRITMDVHALPDVDSKSRVLQLEPESKKATVVENEDHIDLVTTDLKIRIKKDPFRLLFIDSKDGRVILEEKEKGMLFDPEGRVACYKKRNAVDRFYGFGEKAGFLDKGNDKLTMWNTDVYAPHNLDTDPLYVSIPYFMTLQNGYAHGIFFHNTYQSTFDLREKDEYYFAAEGGQLDYFFMAGPTPKDVVQQFTSLTGRAPMPPKWALGFHQSRYGYRSEEEVKEIATLFRSKNIPLDAIYLDIHYMDGYRVFTVDNEKFPNFPEMVHELKEMGIRIVPIIDPGVKSDPEYGVYSSGLKNDLFCKYENGEVFQGPVWPGESAFPDFTNGKVMHWWGDNHQPLLETGIDGIWNDMNEPSVFNDSKTMDVEVVHQNNGDPKTHKELHNLYGLLMAEATFEGLERLNGKRPFVLTRAGYAGIQRFAAVWTGDNRSFWEHLEMSIPMCLNLGLSGVSICGADVGGFAHDTNSELLIRWSQLGSLMPFFRNHSELTSRPQEPWVFGEQTEKIVKRYIEFRYQWLPHLYSKLIQTHRTGLPLMRPLMLEFPNDPNTFNLNDQFMIGGNVIVAPVTRPDASHRLVYLPEGEWVDYWTEDTYKGEQHVLVNAPLDTIPIFVKKGSMILQGPVRQSTEEVLSELVAHCYPSQETRSEMTIYDDDGESFQYLKGGCLEEKLSVLYKSGVIDISTVSIQKEFRPEWMDHLFLVVHQIDRPHDIYLNGERVPDEVVINNPQQDTIKIPLNI